MDMFKNMLPQSGPGHMNPALMGHADRLWKMLDTMAESDPDAYRKFIADQARAAGFPAGAPDLLPESPVILLQSAMATSTTEVRTVISLWNDLTGQVPPAVCAGHEEITTTTSQWKEVDIRFLPKQPPFEESRDGVHLQIVELRCHPRVLELAARGTPLALRAVLAESALRHVEHMVRAPLDRRRLTLQVARAALKPEELKAAEERLAAAAVRKAAQETLKEPAPRSLLSQLSQMAVTKGGPEAPCPLPGMLGGPPKPPQPPKKVLIQEL